MAETPRLTKLRQEKASILEGAVPGPSTLRAVDTQNFSEWKATITGSKGQFRDRLLVMTIMVGEEYPQVPPTIRFEKKLRLKGVVDRWGYVDIT